MKLIVAPSILACDLARLGESIRDVEAAGADWHHVDIMDGYFVPNLTFGPDIVKTVKRVSTKPIDVHLMVEEPARHAEAFAQAGADVITFHIEVAPDPRPLLCRIREMGARPGLVVRPKTPVSALYPFLNEIDFVLIMTVEPGFTGQEFMPHCVGKIAELRRRVDSKFDIEVDGGLNSETVVLTSRAGANVVVAGAAIYRAPDVRGAIQGIRESMRSNYCEYPGTAASEK